MLLSPALCWLCSTVNIITELVVWSDGKISKSRGSRFCLRGLQKTYNFTHCFCLQKRRPSETSHIEKKAAPMWASVGVSIVLFDLRWFDYSEIISCLLGRRSLRFTTNCNLPGHLCVNMKLLMTSLPWSAVGEFRYCLCCSPAERGQRVNGLGWCRRFNFPANQRQRTWSSFSL